MINAELIEALRNCSSPTVGSCTDCPYYKGVSCKWQMMEDAADALEAAEKRIAELEAQEPTEKQVVDYCHKRCFVIVEGELFQRMKATYALMPKNGKWIEHRRWGFCRASPITTNYHCSICDHEESHNKYPYCPNCGAKMKTVTDCHALEEGER